MMLLQQQHSFSDIKMSQEGKKMLRPVTHFFSPFAFEFEIPWLAVIFWRAIFNQPK